MAGLHLTNKLRLRPGPKKGTGGRPKGSLRIDAFLAQAAWNYQLYGWPLAEIGWRLREHVAISRGLDVPPGELLSPLGPAGGPPVLEGVDRYARRALEEHARRHIFRAIEILERQPKSVRQLIMSDIAVQQSVIDLNRQQPFYRERKGGRGPKRSR